jgi:PAS domain S-box-containing protein
VDRSLFRKIGHLAYVFWSSGRCACPHLCLGWGRRVQPGLTPYWQEIRVDITERKEEALRESELRLRTVITNVPVVLFALDRKGVFTLSEGRGLDILGLEAGEAVGRSVSELYENRPEILEDIDRALAGEEFSAVREVDSRVFEMWYSPLRARIGEVTGVIGVATDVTERKRAEEETKEVNRRLEELAVLKADFTAMVAHGLDKPLAVIRGYADMLATGELGASDRDRALAKIQTETDVMAALIADARTAAVIEREDFVIKPRRVPIGALMKDAGAFAKTLRGDHPLVFENVADGQEVWADPYRSGQMLRNLLSNAANYSPDGAPIELWAAPGDTPGRVRIEVADRGVGVHPDDVISTDGFVELLRLASRRRERDYEAQRAIEKLTPREREVIRAIADGLSDREIAERFHFGVGTARNHIVSIFGKLAVHSLAASARVSRASRRRRDQLSCPEPPITRTHRQDCLPFRSLLLAWSDAG